MGRVRGLKSSTIVKTSPCSCFHQLFTYSIVHLHNKPKISGIMCGYPTNPTIGNFKERYLTFKTVLRKVNLLFGNRIEQPSTCYLLTAPPGCHNVWDYSS